MSFAESILAEDLEPLRQRLLFHPLWTGIEEGTLLYNKGIQKSSAMIELQCPPLSISAASLTVSSQPCCFIPHLLVRG